MEEIYTLEEVAEKLKVDLRTIQKWVREGRIKARKMGKSWRIVEGALKDFIENLPTNEPKEE